jgi:hypothetical protein
MKQLTIFLATLVLTGLALSPAAARADDLDDLEVTMEVFDDLSDLDGEIARMDGPDHDDVEAGEDDFEEEMDDDDAEDGSGAGSEVEFADEDNIGALEDDFEEDADFDDESELNEEDDFEEDEGEDLDEDEYDEDDYDDDMDDDMEDDSVVM